MGFSEFYLTVTFRWNERASAGLSENPDDLINDSNGFGSISRRSSSSKPIIAAVNGGAYGGGVEIVLNCDIVIASEDAVFALPEVKRGVVAIQGGTSTPLVNHSNLLGVGFK